MREAIHQSVEFSLENFDCKYLENVALINGVIDPPTLCSKIDLCDA